MSVLLQHWVEIGCTTPSHTFPTLYQLHPALLTSTLTPDHFDHLPGDTIKGGAPPSPERRSSGGGACSVYERMPSLKQLQVDVGGAAGTGVEAGKLQRQDKVTAAVAAESGAVLGSLLVPALRAAALDNDAVQVRCQQHMWVWVWGWGWC